jgi:cytochrome P450
MNWTVTPTMKAQRAHEVTSHFDLRALPRDFLDNPYPVYAQLRERSPVLALPDGSFFLTRHADVVAVYKDANAFCSDKQREFGPKYGIGTPLHEHHTSSLVFNDPPLHTRVRSIIMGALTRRAIDEMQADLITLVDGLLDHLQAQGGGDLVEDFAASIPVEIIGNLLGVPHADRGPLRDWSLAILGALEPTLSADQIARGHASVSAFTAYLKDLVAQRTRQPGDPERDVLTRLIQARGINGQVQPLSATELLHNCIFLLNAGHETTTNLIANALLALVEWPTQRRDLTQRLVSCAPNSEAEALLLSPAVDEFLRMESSNQLSNRRALMDTAIAGVVIPAHSNVHLCIGAANRDAAVFDRPESMDLARTPNKHLAFGFGIHQCAGMSLARLEGRVALGRFLRRFPNYALTANPVRGGRMRFRGFLSAPFSTQA